MWLVGTSVCDIVIAMSMLHYMRHARTGFRATTTLLTKIIRVSIETGLICATFALLDLSIFLSYPHNNYHIPLCMCLSKIYSNSLLAVCGVSIICFCDETDSRVGYRCSMLGFTSREGGTSS